MALDFDDTVPTTRREAVPLPKSAFAWRTVLVVITVAAIVFLVA